MSSELPCGNETFSEEECKNCPDPCTNYCSHGIHKTQKGLDPECEGCEDRECEEPDTLVDEKGSVNPIIREAPNIKIVFRKMFSKKPSPTFQVGDTVTTEFDTKGKIIRIETHKSVDGKVYAVQDETGKTELYHETAIKEKATQQKSIATFF